MDCDNADDSVTEIIVRAKNADRLLGRAMVSAGQVGAMS